MLAVLAYRTANALARVLPAPIADPLAVVLARMAFALRLPARRALEGNLARLLPGIPPAETRRRARASFENFSLAFARFLRRTAPVPGPTRDTAVVVHGSGHLERARASGRGVIVLSAHLGDWEGGAAFLAAQGLAMHIAARPHAHPAIERLFAGRRAASGVRVLAGAPLFARAAAALRRNEWIALMADRPAARTGGGSVCAWAAALARRTGAIVLPAVFVRHEDGRLALCVEAPLTAELCRDGAFRDAMRAWLERWPDQWAAFEPLPEGLA